MLFKSQVFTQVSGSVGGLTFAHNRGGLYTRARSIPVNPNTALQQTVRSLMAQLSQAWSVALTDAQRLGWDAYAATTPVINRLGDQTFLTGQNMYVRGNLPRMQGTLLRIDDAPAAFGLPTLQTGIVVGATGTNDFDVPFVNTDEWANQNAGALLIYQSPPVSAAINFYKGPFAFAGEQLGDSTTAPTTPVTISGIYPLLAGQQLFIRTRAVTDDGRLSQDQIFPGDVV